MPENNQDAVFFHSAASERKRAGDSPVHWAARGRRYTQTAQTPSGGPDGGGSVWWGG